MIELKPALKERIEKEAEEYGTAMDNCGSVIQSYAKKDYVEGATAYAFKWQQAEEMMEKMAKSLTTINKITGIYEKYSDEQLRDRIDTIRELFKDVIKVSDSPIADYQIYKKQKDGTVNG